MGEKKNHRKWNMEHGHVVDIENQTNWERGAEGRRDRGERGRGQGIEKRMVYVTAWKKVVVIGIVVLCECLCHAGTAVVRHVIHGVDESVERNLIGTCVHHVMPSILVGRDRLVTKTESNREDKSITSLNEFSIADFAAEHERSRNAYRETDFFVLPVVPLPSEISEYKSLKDAFTQVNYALAQGIVRGEPTAAVWAAREETSWTVAPDSPLSNRTVCLAYANLTFREPIPLFSDNDGYRTGFGHGLVRSKAEMLSELNDFYLIFKRHALITETGVVASQCGYFIPLEGCETRFKFVGGKWFSMCSSQLAERGLSWRQFTSTARFEELLTSNGSTASIDTRLSAAYWRELCLPKTILTSLRSTSQQVGHREKRERYFAQYLESGIVYHKRVIVISAAWDHNYHHFLFDLLARIVRFLPFLKAHPDVKIHTRAFESNFKYKNNNYENAMRLRRDLMRLIGLDENRLIFGFVKAEEVYLPRAMYCNQVLTNALELRLLAKICLANALAQSTVDYLPIDRQRHEGLYASPFIEHQVANDLASGTFPRTIVLQQRYCEVSANCTTKSWRSWTADTHTKYVAILQEKFPNSRILTVSDNRTAQVGCLSCEVRAYADADVLIGLHGAGLTNTMFMKPGSTLFEITGQFDGRMLPHCGYHGPMASVFGLHHYIYLYDWRGEEELNFAEAMDALLRFYADTRKKS